MATRFRSVKVLGAVLRARRHELGLSQAQVAENAGVSREFVLRLERGKPRIDLGLILAVIEALDCDLELGPRKTDS